MLCFVSVANNCNSKGRDEAGEPSENACPRSQAAQLFSGFPQVVES